MEATQQLGYNTKKVVYLTCIFGVVFFSSCKKDLTNYQISVSAKAKDPIPPFIFNWEISTYMPTNPANIVPMPWIGSVGGINSNIVSDYKKADGWELVYNTFNNSASPYLGQIPPGGLYFALYNKFRGLLRFYLYIPTGTATPTSNIAHGLSLYGNSNSSLLNFDGNDIVDLSINKTAIMKTNNQQLNIMGNWLSMQYELAYDPNIGKTTYPNFGLQWNSQAVNVSSIVLNGTQTGTLTGTISTPSASFDPASLFSGLTAAGLQLYGLSDVSALQATAPAGSRQANFLSGLSSAISGGLSSSLSNLFSGVFGGNSNNSQEVNVTMNTTINLAGNLTNNIGITNPVLVISGQSNVTTANGPTPAYLQPLGVFNLSNKPTVIITEISRTVRNRPRPYSGYFYIYHCTAAIDDNSFTKIINPYVQSLATVTLASEEIIFVNPDLLQPTPQGTNPNLIYLSYNGTKQTIGNTIDLVGTTDYNSPFTTSLGNTVTVRLTFNVAPNNGAPASKIIKTFLANVVYR